MIDVTWRRPTAATRRAGGVDVWLVDLVQEARKLGPGWGILSPAEREKATRFRAERDRLRYAASHVALRGILSRYTEAHPASLTFVEGANGRPGLKADHASAPPVAFSLSHAGDLALCAVLTAGTVGVDIERVDHKIEVESLVTRWLSRSEQATFAALSREARRVHFFGCWTRREALLKATGEGLASAEENGRLHADPPPGWRVRRFVPAPDYVAAVVTSDSLDVAWWRWEAA